MRWHYRLLFGPIGALILTLGILGLALKVPGYSHVHQTVSEIGEIGSPVRIPFAAVLCCVAACLFICGWGVRDLSLALGHSAGAGYLIGAMGIAAAGVGLFAYPHPLHNVFGLSELIGYQAPLWLALSWRRDSPSRNLVRFSWASYLIVCIAILLNLSSLDRQGAIWTYVRPVYGLAQRGLFAAWFGWCAITGVLLFRRSRKSFPLRAKPGRAESDASL